MSTGFVVSIGNNALT